MNQILIEINLHFSQIGDGETFSNSLVTVLMNKRLLARLIKQNEILKKMTDFTLVAYSTVKHSNIYNKISSMLV